MGNRTFCKKQSDVPKEPHYAIVYFRTISTPDYYDKGSYGSETVADYVVYHNKAEWEVEVKNLTLKNDKMFSAMFINPAVTETEVKVNIKI
jgi:hypothetical protein